MTKPLYDTTRADSLGCYGGPEGLTPALDGLARGGVAFLHQLQVRINLGVRRESLDARTNPMIRAAVWLRDNL